MSMFEVNCVFTKTSYLTLFGRWKAQCAPPPSYSVIGYYRLTSLEQKVSSDCKFLSICILSR